MKKNLILFFVLACVLTLAIASGCDCGDDDDDNDDNDVADDDVADDDVADDDVADDDVADDDVADDDVAGNDWWPPDGGQTYLYEVAEWTPANYELEAQIIGDDNYGGETYTKVQLGDFTEDDIIGLQGWFDFNTEDQIGLVASHLYWTNFDKADTEPDGMFEMDDIIYMYLSDTLDDPQTDTGAGTWTVWGNPTTFYVELTSTTLDNDATVTVPYGTVEHCKKVLLESHEEFGIWPDSDAEGTLYFHDELGLVKMEGDYMMGFKLELKDVL